MSYDKFLESTLGDLVKRHFPKREPKKIESVKISQSWDEIEIGDLYECQANKRQLAAQKLWRLGVRPGDLYEVCGFCHFGVFLKGIPRCFGWDLMNFWLWAKKDDKGYPIFLEIARKTQEKLIELNAEELKPREGWDSHGFTTENPFKNGKEQLARIRN